MQLSRVAFIFIVAAVAIPAIAMQNADAKKTTKKAKVAYASSASGKHYFVPPPPPYVPNLLPSGYGQYYLGSNAVSQPKQNTVETMYGKYVYTRPGYKVAQPVQQNKYVTVWSKL